MQRYDRKTRSIWAPQPPKSLLSHYQLENYSEEQVGRIAFKYLKRAENIRRAWVRLYHHFPETTSGEPLDILEFSTAHGAMLEAWRHFGHRVRGADYSGFPDDYDRNSKKHKSLDFLFSNSHEYECAPTNLGWVYQPIIESLDLEVDLFDAGQLPYLYEDKSYDIICCYQAIEAYAEPDRWIEIVEEFCRIARRSIVIGFNALPRSVRNNPDSQAAFRKAIEDILNWKGNGFECSFLEFGRSPEGGQPTAVKLSASQT